MKLALVIRFTNALSSTEQIPDLSLPITINFEKDDINKLVNVLWLKACIRSKAAGCAKRRLKLIYNGRVLNDKTDFEKEVLSSQKSRLNDNDRIYIHCVVGEELTNSQLQEENRLDNKPQEVTTTPNVIGFDRLLQQGFSAEDVSDLRRQFLLIYGNNAVSGSSAAGRDIADLEEIENNQRAMRELEERWIESTSGNGAGAGAGAGMGTSTSTSTGTGTGVNMGGVGGGADNAGNNNSSQQENTEQTQQIQSLDMDESHVNEDLLLGFCIGVFLGIISVVFLLVDDSIFNKRQKMSVIAGLFINFSLAIVRGQWI